MQSNNNLFIKHQPGSQGLSSSLPRERDEETEPGKEVDKTYLKKPSFDYCIP